MHHEFSCIRNYENPYFYVFWPTKPVCKLIRATGVYVSLCPVDLKILTLFFCLSCLQIFLHNILTSFDFSE